ncbi:hypothetical protein J4216_04355, partial [Candidatus Woesearchaeota archaeon]|nr:hypothetical protein [Candidatus Woesearchaeota archaeon]
MARFRIKEIILKNDLFVRAISILQIFLIISLTFVISLNFNSPNVYAAEETFGCCSKTKQDSDGNVNYCEITTRQACDGSWAATSCDQTAFCSLGVCANNDGYCYNNYPKALCESRDNSTHYRGKSINEINECKLGCCLIGTQAAYITRNKCITSTTEFASDLEVDFREDVNSEQECLNLAQNTEEGCCVTESSCSFGAKSTCNLPDAVNGTGFYKNTYCSQLSNSCDCAPANPTLDRRKGTGDLKSTMCLPDRDEVYWRDSCGNPEGIKENCNYNEGTLCGDSDGNGVFVCESLACLDEDGKKSQEDKFSFELSSYIGRGTDKGELTKDGVLNGESWCEYDSAYQEQNNANPSTAGRLGRDPPGSRYYRSLCINGQELVEPCKDFREEFCYKNTVPINTSEGDKDYTEARCIPNEWQVCVNECNTADSTTMDQATYQRALEKDAECCLNRPNRDCAWNGNKCVPAVAPGFKYWEGEGADICSRGSTTCSAVFVCKGWNAILGQCSEDVDKAARVGAQGGIGAGAGAIFAGVAAGGFVAAPVIIGGVLAFALIGGSAHFDDGWNIVSGAECLSVNYLQASNNLCRSMGDCGADFNYLHNYGGVDNNHSLSYNGFSMTPTLQESDDENLNQILAYLKSDAGVDGIEKALEISIKSDKEREEELKIDIPDRKEKIIVETKNSVPASFEGNKKNDKDDLVPVWGEPTIDKNEKSYEKDRTKVSGRDFYDYVGSKDERFGGFGRALIGDIENDDSFRAAYGFVFSPIGAGAISIVASLVGAAFAPAGITYGTAFSAGIATTPLGTGVNSLIGLGADAASAKVGELGLSGLRSATEKAAVDGARTGFTEAIAGRAAFTDVQKAALREVITEEFGEGAVESLADQAINAYSLPAGQSPAQLSFEFGGRELTEKQLIQKTSDKLGQKAVEQSSKAAGENLGFSSGASYLAGISGAMWAYTAYQIVDVIAEDTQTLTISTTCQPWQAPVYQYKENEDPCTKCNPDHKDYVDEQGNPDDVRAFKTCSEYRCKSLGASCNLINKGTTEETCVSLNKLDTASPKVSAWKEGFIIEGQNREKKIFKYETHVRETANTELKINYDIPIYKTFTIGLKTDEPSQCKMSFKHSRRYEEMENFYFGSNTHKYFHVQTMTYPNTKNATSDKNNKLTGGGNYTLYVRCIDAVGNANERDYVIELDVEKEPDVTPPTIVGSSITPPDEGLKL